jgi:hypothetical protein
MEDEHLAPGIRPCRARHSRHAMLHDLSRGRSAIEPACGWLARAAWALVEHAPASADPIFQLARRWIRPLASPFLPVELRHGRIRGGREGTLLLVGRGMLLEYLSRRLFIEEPARESRPAVALHRLRHRLARFIDSADLLFALVPRVIAAHAAGASLLRVPGYVDFLMPTNEVADLERASERLRAKVRKLREVPLVIRVSHDPAQFERFYFDFYVPMIIDRHGDLAIRQHFHVLRRRFRFGGIIWVELDGVPLAGSLHEVRGKTLNMLGQGRQSRGNAKLDAQVTLAKYWAILNLARELGCALVNMGGAVPVLTDGVFRYKRAWSARVVPRAETHSELLVGWHRPGPAVLQFLADAPLIYRAARSLAAVTAIDTDDTADPREGARLQRALLPRGVRDLTIMAPAGWAPAEQGWTLPPPSVLRLSEPITSAGLVAKRACPA